MGHFADNPAAPCGGLRSEKEYAKRRTKLVSQLEDCFMYSTSHFAFSNRAKVCNILSPAPSVFQHAVKASKGKGMEKVTPEAFGLKMLNAPTPSVGQVSQLGTSELVPAKFRARSQATSP